MYTICPNCGLIKPHAHGIAVKPRNAVKCECGTKSDPLTCISASTAERLSKEAKEGCYPVTRRIENDK